MQNSLICFSWSYLTIQNPARSEDGAGGLTITNVANAKMVVKSGVVDNIKYLVFSMRGMDIF